ncbi:MAG: collagen-like protein [gamma proteobacterium symbiont of Taylorina sp.]|nr:collagen-like protein [gamma proteobacterium symbiont of Taylorina sp.]
MVKFTNIRIAILIIATLMFVVTSELSATPPGQVNDEVSANAMYVKYASVNWGDNLLLIGGVGFPVDAGSLVIMLGDDKLKEVEIDDLGIISAILPDDLLPVNGFQGDVLLVVTNNKKPVRTASFMLTIGAVGPQGAVGSQGVEGKKGQDGADGQDGAPGSDGTTQVEVEHFSRQYTFKKLWLQKERATASCPSEYHLLVDFEYGFTGGSDGFDYVKQEGSTYDNSATFKAIDAFVCNKFLGCGPVDYVVSWKCLRFIH